MNRPQQRTVLVSTLVGLALAGCAVPELLGKDDAGDSGDQGASETDSAYDTDASLGATGTGGPETGEPETGEPETVSFEERCPSVAAETAQCIVATDREVVAIGLDSGDVCVVDSSNSFDGEGPTPFIPLDGGLAWEGDTLYGCHALDESLRMQTYTLSTGATQQNDTSCASIASGAGGTYYQPASPGNVHVATGLAAAFAGEVGVDTTIVPTGTRMAVSANLLWTAAPQGNVAIPHTLPSGEQLAPVALQGADEWLAGMTYLAGNLLVLQGQNIVFFDAESGDETNALALGNHGQPAAIACRTP